MPRSRATLEAAAEAAADRLEALTVDEMERWEWKDATPLREINAALTDVAKAEARLHGAVATARGRGFSWATIGIALGTTGESARQRYGQEPTPPSQHPAPTEHSKDGEATTGEPVNRGARKKSDAEKTAGSPTRSSAHGKRAS